jgi:hypothetical protein
MAGNLGNLLLSEGYLSRLFLFGLLRKVGDFAVVAFFNS